MTSDTLLIHLVYMATTKRRLNISLSKDVEGMVATLAKRDGVPEATKVSELLRTSLALEEDRALSLRAEARLGERGAKLTHAEVWG